jgi:hypothetical protein
MRCLHCRGVFVVALSSISDRKKFCSRHCADQARRRDTCHRGHPRIPGNLSVAGTCLTCMKIASAKQNEKRRLARQAAKD